MATPANTVSEAAAPGPARKRARRSAVWQYFTEDEANHTVVCKLCKVSLKYNNNTSAMQLHLDGKHPQPTPSKASSTTAAAGSSNTPAANKQTSMGSYTHRPLTEQRRKKITELLVNFIIKDVRPIAAVHGEGFMELIKFFEPNYTIPCHKTIWKTINKQYDTVRETITQEMEGKSVSLTTDLWTSCTMDPYITVTAHYITDVWKIKSKVLRTDYMTERHTAVNIADKLTETINDWDVSVFSTVHDNASSMNLAMELCQQFPSHLGCTGHTLQLAIKAGLDLPDVEKMTAAARRLVGHFRHSSVAHVALKKCQESLGKPPRKLQNDCATRWNSTFAMVECLFMQRIPVQAVLNDEQTTKPAQKKSFSLKSAQWDLMEHLIPLLRPLAKATTIMCGQAHVGLSFIYPVILNLVGNTLAANEKDSTISRTFKAAVRKQLISRFKLESDTLAESVPITACMLDPRFKQLKFLPDNMREEAWEHLKDLLPPDVQAEPGAAGDD